MVTDRSVGKLNQTTYTVARGDTLYSIAWRFDLTTASRCGESNWSAVYDIPRSGTAFDGEQTPGAATKRSNGDGGQGSRQTQGSIKTAGRNARAGKIFGCASVRAAAGRNKGSAETCRAGLKNVVSAVAAKTQCGVRKKQQRFGLRDFVESKGAQHAQRRGGLCRKRHRRPERLVIVKHSSELLSAYSFNGKMLVAEQQRINGGMVIAEILPRPGVGQTLHFELRRKGMPIDPQTLIRQRQRALAFQQGEFARFTFPLFGIRRGVFDFGNVRPQFCQFGIELDKDQLILRYFVIGEFHRLGTLAHIGTVNTFIRMNHQHVGAFVEAIDWTDFDTVRVLTLDAVSPTMNVI